MGVILSHGAQGEPSGNSVREVLCFQAEPRVMGRGVSVGGQEVAGRALEQVPGMERRPGFSARRNEAPTLFHDTFLNGLWQH